MKKISALFVLLFSLATCWLMPQAQAKNPETLLKAFTLGMSTLEAQRQGARTTDTPDMLQSKVEWKGLYWDAVLFGTDTVTSIGFVSHLGSDTLGAGLTAMADTGLIPLLIHHTWVEPSGEQGRADIALFQSATEKNGAEVCYTKALEAIKNFTNRQHSKQDSTQGIRRDADLKMIFYPAEAFLEVGQAMTEGKTVPQILDILDSKPSWTYSASRADGQFSLISKNPSEY